MEKLKFKEVYETEKERLNQKQSFKKFKRQMAKLDKSINSFNAKYL